MKVNASKTAAMVISELKSYLPDAYFCDSVNNKIKTAPTKKILPDQMFSGYFKKYLSCIDTN